MIINIIQSFIDLYDTDYPAYIKTHSIITHDENVIVDYMNIVERGEHKVLSLQHNVIKSVRINLLDTVNMDNCRYSKLKVIKDASYSLEFYKYIVEHLCENTSDYSEFVEISDNRLNITLTYNENSICRVRKFCIFVDKHDIIVLHHNGKENYIEYNTEIMDIIVKSIDNTLTVYFDDTHNVLMRSNTDEQ